MDLIKKIETYLPIISKWLVTPRIVQVEKVVEKQEEPKTVMVNVFDR